MREQSHRTERGLYWGCWALLVVGLLLSGYERAAVAKTIYSYMDEQGNLHATDNPALVPERYQSKVRMHEQPDPVPAEPTKMESTKQSLKERWSDLHVPLPHIPRGALALPDSPHFSGLSPAQSQLLTYAGGVAVIVLAMLYITKSQMLRLLGIGLLTLLAIGTPILFYLSEDGSPDIMKAKAQAAAKTVRDPVTSAGR